MKIAFFGTGEFAVAAFTKLKELGVIPELIVTTPDQPQGRGQHLRDSKVGTWAAANNLKIIKPEKLKDTPPELDNTFDVFIVADYGKLIPEVIFNLPRGKTLNIHPSLLPHYRGPSPLAAPILNGDAETGVTIIQLDNEMDHGPIAGQATYPLTGQEYLTDLRDSLAKQGAELIAKLLPDWLAGKITAQVQDENIATFTTKITKAETEINLADPAELNYRKIRAYTPNPSAYFFARPGDATSRIIIKSAHLESGQLILDRVLPAGQKETDWSSIANNFSK